MLRPTEKRPVIKLKSPREINLMRDAGRVVAQALDQVRRIAAPGVTTGAATNRPTPPANNPTGSEIDQSAPPPTGQNNNTH